MYRSVSKLSQAAAHPRRGTNIPVMENPARNERHATQQERKSKGENRVHFKDLHARNDPIARAFHSITSGTGFT
jgi:hypothetical protein